VTQVTPTGGRRPADSPAQPAVREHRRAARRAGAPGDAADTSAADRQSGTAGQPGTDLAAVEAATLAARYGLLPSSRRPSLVEYIQRLWSRRHFIMTFATAQTATQYSGARLGQLWHLLTPLLNAAVYYLIFGLLLKTSRGLADPNQFISFLVIGIFLWTFINRSITSGAKSIPTNLSLVRALHFPRACLPIAGAIVELEHLLISLIVMVVIVLLRGEPLTVEWLIFLPTLGLLTIFCVGMSLIFGRLGARLPDVVQLLPFSLRAWMYASGVFYNIDRLTANHPTLSAVMQVNPVAVYVDLGRAALLHGFDVPPHGWLLGGFWAALALVFGFIFFWRAEARYGRG